jgi:hypothetical protein
MMNTFRELWGLPTVTCVSQADLTEALTQINVLIDIQNNFFDPYYYNNNGKMETESTIEFSTLTPDFMQIKDKTITLN